ncbi:MAG: hypothetical protein GY940_44195, partial [bacterium]|nr:hypothetical protein [bacterium]
ELNNIYLKLKTVPEYTLPPLGCGYKDSVISEIIDSRDPETIAWWKNELTDYKRTVFLETLKINQKTTGMTVYHTSAGEDVLRQLRDLTGTYTTSLKHLCFGAYLFVMNMLTYESDIILGMVTNNRPVHEDGDKVLGCFLNTTPVRFKVPTDLTWAGYIKMTAAKLREVRQYERFPLFEIARVIGEHSKDNNPIFDALFNFTDFHIYKQIENEEDSGGATGDEPVGFEEPDTGFNRSALEGSQVTNTLFDFEVDVTSGVLSINPKYVPSAVSAELVEKSCVWFKRVLNKLIQEPNALAVKNDIL